MTVTSAMPTSDRSTTSSRDEQSSHLQDYLTTLLQEQPSAVDLSANMPGFQQQTTRLLPPMPAFLNDTPPVAMTMPPDLSWLLDSDQQACGRSIPSDSIINLVPPAEHLASPNSPLAASAWPFLQLPSSEAMAAVPRAADDGLLEPIKQAAVLTQRFFEPHVQSVMPTFPQFIPSQPCTDTQGRPDAQKGRLNEVRSLHPLCRTAVGSTMPVTQITPHQRHDKYPSATQAYSRKRPRCATLPRCFTDLILVVDQSDMVLCMSSSFRLCARTLSFSTPDSLDDTSEGWHAWTSDDRRVRFQDFLADKHAVDCWQRACRFIRSTNASHFPFSESSQTFKTEIILKRRSPNGKEEFVEVVIVAPKQACGFQNGELMVRMRPVTLPSVASVSSGASNVPSMRPWLVLKELSNQQATFHLLVSRSGLVLRASCSPDSPGSMQREHNAAIFGDSKCCPVFGQSLVDVPRLAPLLPVVAQVAVVGLAQTIELNAGAGKTTVTVQPVLRSATNDGRLPAAKVWITLSMSSIVKHQLTETSRKTNIVVRSPADNLRGGSQDRKLKPSQSSLEGMQQKEHATPLQDSLGPIMARLREENRMLRQQVEARLRRQASFAQQQHLVSA